MDGWIPLLLPLAFSACALLVAFDYRNFGLKVYDLMARRSPGGGLDPRFTPDALRVLAGFLGVIFLVATGVQMIGLL
ncbi:hypothetical protein ACIQRS_31420 [Streptomyces termitum]|uniref:Uncharacterized protein n=1 Tax=Streptomyces termitum TaxID=67368 RepID=A0A918WDG5_9ACTN|nr:hypothetical protein [Streptomyces termitum]GHB06416.1 hypothetical protein GCM10010305_57100 [Streptomyces termitum]